MHKLKNKTMAISIVLLLMLSITSSMIIVESVNATINVGTNAWVTAAPDPVGVGQTVIIGMGLVQVNPLSQLLTSANVSNVWNNYKLSIVDPTGVTTTAGPFTADYTAVSSYAFTPNTVGNYTITFIFPGQLVNSYGHDEYYAASNSTIPLTVQQDPIYALALTPLPTDYWTRPINWQNVLWSSISGNWLGVQTWEQTNVVNPYTTAPATAHVMWTKPLEFGGQVGGGSPYNQTDISNYYTGKSYQWPFSPPIIINGVLYYNSPSNIAPDYGFYAVDLRTGQTLWYNNGTNLSTNPSAYGGFNLPVTHWPGITYGQVYSWHNPNEVGGVAYLWGVVGSTYQLFDANTGKWILNVVNSPGGTAIIDPQSELLVYTLKAINNTTGWIAMWNATKCLGAAGFAVNPIEYRPSVGATLQWSTGIQWNVTVPIYPYSVPASGSVAIGGINDGVILVLGTEQVLPGTVYQTQNYQTETGYSAINGQLLWGPVNRTIDMGPETSQLRMEDIANGVYTEHNKEDNTYYAFDIHTGQQLWGKVKGSSYAWDLYTRNYASDNGIVYFLGPESIQAISIANGTFLWDFAAPSAGVQESAPTYLFEGEYGLCTGGGMVFVSGSSSHGDALFRGAKLYAVNGTTGKEQWSIDGFFIGKCFALADGYLVDYNGYDNQVYCFGQGPSKTTVAAPNIGVTTSTPISITGAVTDIAAGTKQDAVASNFPNGLPCVSDASMGQFMASVYEQQQMPNNVTGVPVTISVRDSNGNDRVIGTTTTNSMGTYGLTWTPDIAGTYTVTATFEGSGAYYGSSASTYFYASEPAPTASPAPVAGTSMVDQYILPGIIGIIVAIVIGFAVTILVLRKRP
jgi:hypothetical protein